MGGWMGGLGFHWFPSPLLYSPTHPPTHLPKQLQNEKQSASSLHTTNQTLQQQLLKRTNQVKELRTALIHTKDECTRLGRQAKRADLLKKENHLLHHRLLTASTQVNPISTSPISTHPPTHPHTLHIYR